MQHAIRTIKLEELKAKLDRGDEFRLVMTLGDFAYRAAHIPGSEHFPTAEATFEALHPDEEIVVYCSDETCVASQKAYRALVDRGYGNVWRYAGGLSEWHSAGYPLEGEDSS